MTFRTRAGTVLAAAAALALLGPAGPAAARTRPPAPRSAPSGYDVGWPQCGAQLPSTVQFAVVGASNGLAYSDNPCLARELAWAQRGTTRAASLYMNTANPGSASSHWNQGGPKACSGASEDVGCAYDYGWQAAAHALDYARAQLGATAAGSVWWLDVETGNTWSTNAAANTADIAGMSDYLSARTSSVGVYSTRNQWDQITGSSSAFGGLASWVAGAPDAATARAWCTSAYSFTGGRVSMVQFPRAGLDGDVGC